MKKQVQISVFGLIFFLFLTVQGYSQRKPIEIDDSTGLHSYIVQKNDTVVIRLDNAYVLNKRTFRLLQDNYNRVKSGDPALKRLLADYENLIALQDSMLKDKEAYYQQLKTNFDTLVRASNTFITKTDVNIHSINKSLTNASDQLQNIKGLLDSSLEKLKDQNRLKFKAALGGFAIGVGVTGLIFLVAK